MNSFRLRPNRLLLLGGFAGFMASSSALWDGDTPQQLPQVVYPRKPRRFAKMGTEGTLQRWPNFGGEW